jgi:hypothetical protein
MPNAKINLPAKQGCRFFSGDWKKLEEHFVRQSRHAYDIILTSETIYNIDNYQKLVRAEPQAA